MRLTAKISNATVASPTHGLSVIGIKICRGKMIPATTEEESNTGVRHGGRDDSEGKARSVKFSKGNAAAGSGNDIELITANT